MTIRNKLITSPETVVRLVNEGKAIVMDSHRMPAAFIQNWPFRMIMNLIKNEKLYTYKYKSRRQI